ncbi:MAG TPA: flagellar hook-length control protein FliK [Syntrophomonadaceae bacterium]|nr:flagellar hook-length control protein FliK [Syntrophomonadaceae bacterium]
MNAEPVAPLQFPNNATNSPVGGDNGQSAAVDTLFFRLILALLADARNQGETAKTGMPLGQFGPQQTNSPTLPDQDVKEKSSDASVQEAGALGVLIPFGQNCSQGVLPQGDALPGQALQPVNAESRRLQNVSQADMPGPQFAALFPGLEEQIGQSLNQDSSVDIAQVSVTKTFKRLSDLVAGSQPGSAEISGLTGGGQDTGKAGNLPTVMTGTTVPGESNTPPLQNQPFQGREDRPVCDPKSTGIQPEKSQAYSPQAKFAPGHQKGLQEKAAENAKVQHQPDRPVFIEDVAEQQVLKAETRLPLKASGDPVENSALPASHRGFTQLDPFSPPKLMDGRPEEAAAREVIKQVVDKAHLFVGRGVASLKLQLKPEFLGNLKLTISVEHGLVHARFTAENAAVANLIEARLPELQHALSERGISWHQVSVSVDAQAHSGGFAHAQYEGNGSLRPNPYAFTGESSGQEGPGEPVAASYPGVKGAVDYLV